MELDASARLTLWRAFSELFLDTEIETATFRRIAQVIAEIGCSQEVAHGVLWYEVFPVLEGNLSVPAGVCWGWPDEWLLQRMNNAVRAMAIHGDPAIIEEIDRCWAEVAAHLPLVHT